jgi:hypothetical protein
MDNASRDGLQFCRESWRHDTDMVGPVKVLSLRFFRICSLPRLALWFRHCSGSGIVALAPATRATSNVLLRRWIRLIFAGWLPHDLIRRGLPRSSGGRPVRGPFPDSVARGFPLPFHIARCLRCRSVSCQAAWPSTWRATHQTKPASSRAIAVTTCCFVFPRPSSFL